jgi:cystathionine beta-lyase
MASGQRSAAPLSKDDICDLVLDFLSTRGFSEAEKALKRELQSHKPVGAGDARNGSGSGSGGKAAGSRLEDLLEKSYVTELASGEFFPRKKTRSHLDAILQPVDLEDVDVTMDVSGGGEVNGVAGTERKPLSLETQIISFNPMGEKDPYGAAVMPIYQTATFAQPSANEFGSYDYTRSGNPTRDALQLQIAQLEGLPGARAFCFTTGMAALSAVTRLVKAGEEVIVNDDSYGGTYRLMSKVATRQGIIVTYVNMAGKGGAANLQRAIGCSTKLVMIESPTNPMQRICNIRELARVCHANSHPTGTLLSIDNTMMSPILSRPLEHGADIVIHSATKFLCGHSDTMAGAVIVRDGKGEADKTLAETLYFYQNAEGTALAPFDCWLVTRGIKTMALRVDKQQANALQIATWLQSVNLVSKVFYAGLPDHPDNDIHVQQASGGGAVVCFLTGDLELSKHIVTTTKLFKITVSFGSVTSLISLPGNMSHASIPAEVRSAREFPEDLVRISVGIESAEDLIADLANSICSYRDGKAAAAAAAASSSSSSSSSSSE